MGEHPKQEIDGRADAVVVWIAVLERGRRARDFDLIRRANEELDRLGVHICIDGQRYGSPSVPERRR